MTNDQKYRTHLNDARREIARPPTFSLARGGSATVWLVVDAGARVAQVHVAGEWLSPPAALPPASGGEAQE